MRDREAGHPEQPAMSSHDKPRGPLMSAGRANGRLDPFRQYCTGVSQRNAAPLAMFSFAASGGAYSLLIPFEASPEKLSMVTACWALATVTVLAPPAVPRSSGSSEVTMSARPEAGVRFPVADRERAAAG